MLPLSVTIALFGVRCSEDSPVSKQEIIHINLEDAKAGYNKPFSLDIDKDGNGEFIFNATLIADAVGDHLRFAINSRYGNEVIGEYGNVKVLSSGDPVNESGAFDYDNEVLAVRTITNHETTWWGNWKGIQNKYMGIRFQLNGSSYYGWIAISVNEPNEQVIIHDMAYSKSTNSNGIQAGEH
ncbi:MAG: hypothetical protein ACK4S0_14730 [Sediminibacterium sp.]